MKKTSLYILSVFSVASLLACNPETQEKTQSTTPLETPAVSTSQASSDSTTVANTEGAPTMTFTETEFDFGTIKEGEVVKHTFKFTNTGKVPLVIQNATAPCGCTVPQWPKEPVAPGATGEINVQFNSSGKVGQQNKVVSIVANTQPDITTVTVKGNVEPGVSAMNGPMKQ
jgi:hypothetical protein